MECHAISCDTLWSALHMSFPSLPARPPPLWSRSRGATANRTALHIVRRILADDTRSNLLQGPWGPWTCWDHGASPPSHQKGRFANDLPRFAKGQFRHPSSGPQSWTQEVHGTSRFAALVKPLRENFCIFRWYRFVDSHGKSHAIPVTPFRIEPPATPPFRSTTSSPGLGCNPASFRCLYRNWYFKSTAKQ